MTNFATEFPVKRMGRAIFVAQVISWLRGTKYSTVLDKRSDQDLEGQSAHLKAKTGEELRFREFGAHANLNAIGFRHDFPDTEGRLWRTEAVLSSDSTQEYDLIRLRTQCIARQYGAILQRPRKPYLIKSILQDGWGGIDGNINVADQPHWLKEDGNSIELARNLTCGVASEHLPVVYISASGTSHWLLSKNEIEKLAYDLGGVAHVLVEPSRDFSFKLRDQTAGANVYGGTLGIATPGKAIVRRFYIGWQLQSTADILNAVKSTILDLRSQMPSGGWDWTELQEQALRLQRERERNRLGTEDIERLYQEELDNLQDRIKQLEDQLSTRPVSADIYHEGDGILPPQLIAQVGTEIYPGEFSDRLRFSANATCEVAEQIGLDGRSILVLRAVAKYVERSPALLEFKQDLERATKDPKRVAADVTALLLRHGYREKSDNKHIRLEAKDEYLGLEPITVSKTPSDYRGLKNLRKQIERALGITKL
jgi:hypothetical protein